LSLAYTARCGLSGKAKALKIIGVVSYGQVSTRLAVNVIFVHFPVVAEGTITGQELV